MAWRDEPDDDLPPAPRRSGRGLPAAWGRRAGARRGGAPGWQQQHDQDPGELDLDSLDDEHAAAEDPGELDLDDLGEGEGEGDPLAGAPGELELGGFEQPAFTPDPGELDLELDLDEEPTNALAARPSADARASAQRAASPVVTQRAAPRPATPRPASRRPSPTGDEPSVSDLVDELEAALTGAAHRAIEPAREPVQLPEAASASQTSVLDVSADDELPQLPPIDPLPPLEPLQSPSAAKPTRPAEPPAPSAEPQAEPQLEPTEPPVQALLQSAADQVIALTSESGTHLAVGVGDSPPDDAQPLLALQSAADQVAAWSQGESGDVAEVDDNQELELDLDLSSGAPLAPTSTGTLYDGDDVAEEDADEAVARAARDAARRNHGVAHEAQQQPTPLLERPADADALALASEFFVVLDKAVRTHNLYEGRGKACARSLDIAHAALSEVFEAHAPLTLRVTPYEFLLDGQPVYSSDEERSGLSFRLFRDGVRELSLLPGIERAELAQLIGVLRAVHSDAEHDSVTRLWELDLAGVRYRAIDVFLEGLLDSEADGYQDRIEALFGETTRPLHEPTRTTVAASEREMAQSPAGEAPSLDDTDLENVRALVGQRREELVGDIWQRGLAIYVRMLQQVDSAGTLAWLIGPIIEEMFEQRRWRPLAAACRAIAALDREAQQEGRVARAVAPLTAALRHLCLQGKLVELQPVVAQMNSRQLEPLAEVLALLPAEADRQLMPLLLAARDADVQDRLRALLLERGIDISDYYLQQLESKSIAEAIAAVRALGAIARASQSELAELDERGAEESELADEARGRLQRANVGLRRGFRHFSRQVPHEAACALRGLDDFSELVPDVVAALPESSRQLRGVCFELLASLDVIVARPHGAALLAVLRGERAGRWSSEDRQRGLQLLVSWGGDEANDYIVHAITLANTFRRKKVEAERQEVFEAVQRVGGRRASRLLEACLSRRPPDSIAAHIERALRRLGRGAHRAGSGAGVGGDDQGAR